MARKRREKTPPPPPPAQEKSSSEESSSGEEEEAQGVPTPQRPPQNPKPPSTAAANDDDGDESSEGSDEEEGESSETEIAPPSPPPPQQEEESSEESSSGEEEEEAKGVPTSQRPLQNPKPTSTAVANDESSEGSDEEDEESSDSGSDAEGFQMRQVERSQSKPSAVAPKLESGADEEEDESSDNPEPIQKEEAKKLKADAGKKRLAPEPIPSGKAKKAKAKVEEALPEPTLSGQDKKTKSSAEKAPKLTPSGKAKKLKAEPEKEALDSSSPSKSEKPVQSKKWTLKDEIMILKAAAGHVKTTGRQPGAGDLVSAVGDTLDRKKCTYTEMYDKVRNLKLRYEKAASAGTVPSKGDELQKYKLSEAVWGENAKEVALDSISQKDGTPSKSKKGKSNKEKMVAHSKGGTSKEATTAEETVGTHADSKTGQATKKKIDGDTKSKRSKKVNTTDVPTKNNNHGYHKEEPVEDAKTSTAKEATTAATKEKMDEGSEGRGPKDATVATQNGGTLTQSENGGTQDGMDIDANVQGVYRGLNELKNMYPNLTIYVEIIKAQHPCGETLMRAFQFIDDQKASALESMIKKQRVAEVKMEILRGDTKKELVNILLELLD